MRYLSIYRAVETNEPPSPQHIADMEKLITEFMNSGQLLATEGCLPSALGVKVRRDGATITVTDGPFTEAKEVIGGFAMLQASSKEEAVEIAKRFLDVVGEGECEIRQIFDMPEAQ